MRVFVLDHLFFLLFGVGISIGLLLLNPHPIVMVVLELIIVITWGILCKSMLLFPLDLVFGKRVNTCYFGTTLSVVNYKFFRKKCYWNWRFFAKGSNERLDLHNPISCSRASLSSIEQPPKDRILEITYYPFSKLLISWKIHEAESDQEGSE